ncbi:MAG: type II secretion system F family protein, partial [Chlamydiia bacterium]|nr:type II secretion system F family protein [Chlamydiia bacterium]
MPLYSYRALKPPGRKVTGHIEASSVYEAKLRLREQGLMVSQIEEGAGRGSKNRLKGDQLLTFTLQMSQLVGAGIPLYDALLALEEQYRGESFHPVLLALSEKVKAGTALSDAMGAFPD